MFGNGNCALVDSDALYVSRPPLCRQGQPQRQLAIRADVAIMKSSSADGMLRLAARPPRNRGFSRSLPQRTMFIGSMALPTRSSLNSLIGEPTILA
jgi:hypothetical protein